MYIHPPSQNEVISNSLRSLGIWEPESTEIVRAGLEEGQTFVDCGAHIGYYSLLASSIVGETGRVIAFEPWKPNHDLLVENIKLNGAKNIVPIMLPLWDSVTTLSIGQGSDNTGDVRVSATEGVLTVLSTTLDLLFSPNTVDFLKIDCQGVDPRILRGGRRLISGSEKIKVLVEDHGGVMDELGLRSVKQIPREQTWFFVKGDV